MSASFLLWFPRECMAKADRRTDFPWGAPPIRGGVRLLLRSRTRVSLERDLVKKSFLFLCLVVALGSSGCASQVGTRSSWQLWNTGKRADGFNGLGKTFRLTRGFNDFSDVAQSAHLLTKGPKGGLGIIARDFTNTVIGPWSFSELGVTFRLLR